jgi:formyl-CoA transferase
VHTSLLANGVWSNACLASGAFANAVFPVREVPPPAPRIANRVTYETSDGRFLNFFMVRTLEGFDAAVAAAGRADLLGDPRFADPDSRLEHGLEFVEALRQTFASETAAHWRETFREHGIPVTMVADVEDLPSDPQILVNGIAVPPSDPRVPAPLVINHPLNIDGLARVGVRYAPGVGENTAEVLAEMGFTAEEIEGLAARGVT